MIIFTPQKHENDTFQLSYITVKKNKHSILTFTECTHMLDVSIHTSHSSSFATRSRIQDSDLGIRKNYLKKKSCQHKYKKLKKYIKKMYLNKKRKYRVQKIYSGYCRETAIKKEYFFFRQYTREKARTVKGAREEKFFFFFFTLLLFLLR